MKTSYGHFQDYIKQRGSEYLTCPEFECSILGSRYFELTPHTAYWSVLSRKTISLSPKRGTDIGMLVVLFDQTFHPLHKLHNTGGGGWGKCCPRAKMSYGGRVRGSNDVT